MTLECTLVRGPSATKAAAPEELTIAVPFGTPGVHVQLLLKQARGTDNLSVDGLDLSTLTVGLPPLVSGAVVVDGGGPQLRPDAEHPHLTLLTHSGPSAGVVYRLHRGRFRIGRGSTDISVPDPGMSREHAVLEVSSTAVTLSDVDAANLVFIDDQPTRRRLVTSESTIRCGSSTFTVYTGTGPFPLISTEAGRCVEEPLEVPHTKSTGNRTAMVLTAGIPLVAGMALSLATGLWTYLGFTAISAVSLLVPLLAGRKSLRECRLAVAIAAQEDRERRRRCSPSAADLVVAARGRTTVVGPKNTEHAQGPASQPQPAVSTTGIDHEDRHVWVRLGLMQTVANVRLVPDDPQFRPPAIGFAAVTLDPRHPVVLLRGQAIHVDALIRFMLMQLASYPTSAETAIIILGGVERLPLSARFLPKVTLTTHHVAALAALRQHKGSPSGRLILIDEYTSDEAGSVSSLLAAARLAGWQVVQYCSSSERRGHVIEIGQAGTTGYLEMSGERRQFLPDLVPLDVFDAFCRSLAATVGSEGPGVNNVIPDRCSLAELHPTGPRRILRRWGATVPKGLSAVLGKGRQGSVTFDFQLDGPHLLVAGTTGSGKSELLRTLVASMALNDPPERTTFLFLDFKGGSGLEPLAGLPHCVGLLTDLGKHDVNRALVSLRGETKRREELLAAAGVPHIALYQQKAPSGFPPLPYLVLIIDEFRMLVDEAPGALHELMRVATIGRSLGIHLVMATQRPQGALTADIRANVTSSIALRVQSDAESLDIINTRDASCIPVDAPGRAYLARASSSPEEFQTASLAVSAKAMVDGELQEGTRHPVQTAAHALRHGHDAETADTGQAVLSDGGAEWVVSIATEAWSRTGRPFPRRPVAAPLPTTIRWRDHLPVVKSKSPEANAGSPWVVGPIALLDKPTEQVVEPLMWLPLEHGHLAMVGSASSGMQKCFRAVSAMLATHSLQPHLYILDAIGILGDFLEHQVIGAAAGLHQLPMAARVLKLLAAEMERRRAARPAEGAGRPLVLMVAGWCSWATALRSGPFGWAEGLLLDILRDGWSAGIIVLISGERELVSSRLFVAIQNRAYFPYGATDESRFHWPRLPELESVPGRAVVVGDVVDGSTTVAQFREGPGTGPWPFGRLLSPEPPFRVRPLPELLSEEEFQNRLTTGVPAVNSQSQLWIGVGGDEAVPVSLPLRLRGVSLVLGSRRSGKSTLLVSLRRMNPSVRWVCPPLATIPGPFWASVARDVAAGNLDVNSILLVDDADALDDQGRHALAALAGKVRGIVLAATLGPSLIQHLPLLREVQTSSVGLVLAPQTPHDGELLGARLDADGAARPGRGFVVNGAEVTPFQAVLTAGFQPPTPPDYERDGSTG